MAYTSLYQWARRINTSINYYAVPLMKVGTIFCTSKAGTGINSNHQYFDDAGTRESFGNCASQIKLK
jgi:hypothetical protein